MGGFVNLAQMLSRRAQGLPRQGQRPAQAGLQSSPDLPDGFDPSMANEALAPYGLQEPQHTNPFIMFNDQSGLGASHPKWARFIEGALMGAQTPSGDTIGENIGNVARSVMNVPNAYRQNEMSQFMAPFQMAAPMAQLQQMQANTDMAKAHTAYFDAESKKAQLIKSLPDFKDTKVVKNPVTGGTELWGTNSLTGEYSMVPGSNKANLPDPTEGKDPQGDPYINAAIGPKPIRSATDTDEQFNAKLKAWGKSGTDLKVQMASDPRVAAALARIFPVVSPDGKVTYMQGRDAIGKNAGGVGTAKDMIGYKTAVSGFENALNNVDSNVDVLNNADRRPLITAALKHASADEGFFSQLITGAAQTNLNPKETQFVTSILRARELANGLRPFAGNARSTETMTQRFIEGSIPTGAAGSKFAKQLLNGTRQEVNIIKKSINDQYGGDIFAGSIPGDTLQPNIMSPFGTDSVDDEVNSFKKKKGLK